MQKRKAAANVFMEQQQLAEPALAEERQEIAAYDNDDYYSPAPAGLAGGIPVPPPAPSAQPIPQQARSAPVLKRMNNAVADMLKTSEELQLEKEPIKVRETGFWLWRRVIIPPNAYVVHTRIGRKEPVTLGLGLSFRYDPYKDAYLVVPAAMQTIGIVANGISREKQGINILAYVQWQISDFSIAYRKLDFSDSRDPLGIVNAQLREQAEAAIKDKIATMSVEDVLTDKAPIIAELTTRLKAVAEGRDGSASSGSEGLGITIVTVQIKEAYVSSQRLWQDLQAPYRYEQAQVARVSYLETQDQIREKELETRQLAETREAETLVAIERIKQGKQTEALDVRLSEEGMRFTKEQESTRQRLQLQEQTTRAERESAQRLQIEGARMAQAEALERARLQQTQELERAQLAQAQELERARLDAESAARRKTLETEQALQALSEEQRLAEQRLLAEREQVRRDIDLRRDEYALKELLVQQSAAIQARELEEQLARQRQQATTQLELEEAAGRIRLQLAEREAEIARIQQEIRNLTNDRDLMSRLIEQLPQLAEQMPQIHELKVLQLGDQGEGAYGQLPAFIARMLALADGLGLRARNGHAAPEE